MPIFDRQELSVETRPGWPAARASENREDERTHEMQKDGADGLCGFEVPRHLLVEGVDEGNGVWSFLLQMKIKMGV